MQNQVVFVAALALGLLGCSSTGSGLDRDMDELMQALPGSYAGEAPIMSSPSGEMQDIFHKLAPIDAPQFGERVLYYQLSTGSADGPALQQKIFVLSVPPGSDVIRMRAYVFAPGQAEGNLEQDPDRWDDLDPAALMNFPESCAFTWARVSGGFEATVRPANCSFSSRAFKQMISPDMTYRIEGDRFEWTETLYGEGQRIIVSTDGALVAWRE
jgi:hypothetical protein